MFLVPVGIVGYRVWRNHQDTATAASAAEVIDQNEPGDPNLGIDFEDQLEPADSFTDQNVVDISCGDAQDNGEQMNPSSGLSGPDSQGWSKKDSEFPMSEFLAQTSTQSSTGPDFVENDHSVAVDGLVRDGIFQGLAALWRERQERYQNNEPPRLYSSNQSVLLRQNEMGKLVIFT